MKRAPQRTLPVVDGFPLVERDDSDDERLASIGIAYIRVVVPGIEENKERIVRACRANMDRALTEHHLDWIEQELRPLCDGRPLEAVILNNLCAGEGGYVNRTFLVSPELADPLAPENAYDKIFLPGIEETYTMAGRDDRLVLHGTRGGAVLGFTTCYDCLFVELLRCTAFLHDELLVVRHVDIRGGRQLELDDFDCEFDFDEVHRRIRARPARRDDTG